MTKRLKVHSTVDVKMIWSINMPLRPRKARSNILNLGACTEKKPRTPEIYFDGRGKEIAPIGVRETSTHANQTVIIKLRVNL